MIDPNNVLLRCPAGHELQAARTDLDKDLVCPVCNTTFRPQVDAPPTPSTIGYATGAALGIAPRPKYPAYTVWMLAMWIVSFSGLVGTNIILSLSSVRQNMANAQPASMPVMMMAGVLTCTFFISCGAAIVMQFMWIYRVHNDARKYGGYTAISPLLAVLLTIVPIVHQLWTAVTLQKLARFSAEGRENDAAASSAVHAAKTCLVTSVILTLMLFVVCGIGGASVLQVYSEAIQKGLDPSSPEVRKMIQDAASPSAALVIGGQLLQLAGSIVYAFAVRRVENSLYLRLGALPR